MTTQTTSTNFNTSEHEAYDWALARYEDGYNFKSIIGGAYDVWGQEGEYYADKALTNLKASW